VNDRFDPEKKRGFGFITFDNLESATKAVESMNDVEVNGRAMVVDFATAKGEKRPVRERAPRAPRKNDDGRRVYVGNLDYATNDGEGGGVFFLLLFRFDCAQLPSYI
jgi:polyadenylate-binding protein